MGHPSPSVAIVGIGGIFPDAPDLSKFWDNIRLAKSAAREVPQGRWLIAADRAFDTVAGSADHVYSRRGCFIDSLPPLSELSGLSIDPQSLAGLDPLFHLLLHAGKRAFDSAITEPVDRARVGVIIGNLALPSEKSAEFSRAILGRSFEEKLLGQTREPASVDPLNRYVAGLPAGLLAAALGLGGGCCTLDAACASSLYAIKLAADELLSGRADAMLTGGLSRPDPLFTQMGFSQLRALSRRGVCSPFDAAGDGLVVGEGAGIFLLKRTEDALAHGDRILGVIRGIGLSNDVGGSLLAPQSDGQLRAMRAAYAKAGWAPQDVDLIECHATGTPVGDATEVESLKELWQETRADGNGRCVIGSVKSNIGHTLTAAGAAALTKVLLAMAEEFLPPTANFTRAPAGFELEQSPFQVLEAPLPWPRRADGVPRRAAVSAFGFGGINAHLLVEEWLPQAPPLPKVQPQGGGSVKGGRIAVVGLDARFGPWPTLASFQSRVLGGDVQTKPTTPKDWWGALDCAWFDKEGLKGTPFAGFYLDEITLEASQFRIPPLELSEMLPQQLLMLQSAAAAMTDARVDRLGNLRTGVFIGIALDLNSTNFSFRWSIAEKAAAWGRELGLKLTAEQLSAWATTLADCSSPALTANRTMGALGSVVASRIAREFRCGGPSFTLSSEESSGLRALETAVRQLQEREVDCALVGAVDLAGDLRAVLGQHLGRPFSSSGSALPFDAQADGCLVGEGAASLVLKRLEDAERDGDRIYAEIVGIGAASGAILLPGVAAYNLALERAYGEACVAPESIDYLEAHGSGNAAEDQMEALALAAFFSRAPGLPENRRLAVASVMGEIGHCGGASGLASLIRACLALYQEIIPAARLGEEPLTKFAGPGPLYLPDGARYWLRNRVDGVRHAGVSSFGVDGSCSHAVLAGYEKVPPRAALERVAPLGPGEEFLFCLTGADREALAGSIASLRLAASTGPDLQVLSRALFTAQEAGEFQPQAITLIASSHEQLEALLTLGERTLQADSPQGEGLSHPLLRDRLFYFANPIGKEGRIGFVYPGSGNHYPGMGRELSARWPEIYRRQDRENERLRDQFQPEQFWRGKAVEGVSNNHLAVIFGQVATGCAVSDVVGSFGITPDAVIGYSLGESAGLFASRSWRERDLMLARMQASTLFTRDLAGECRAARLSWGESPAKEIHWSVGLVDMPAREVRRALKKTSRVYLLIVNTPGECVIGGDVKWVKHLVAMLGCRFFPLHGVTTVHCEVARQVAGAYRDLHLFTTKAAAGVDFYSGASGKSYQVSRQSAAESILAQAVGGIDFPKVIEAAYADGVRYFLEMGPGGSCSRMIGQILAGRPHLARSASLPGVSADLALLRLLAELMAQRVPVQLTPLFTTAPAVVAGSGERLHFKTGGDSFRPAPANQEAQAFLPPNRITPPDLGREARSEAAAPVKPAVTDLDALLGGFASAEQARFKAHEAYLRLTAQLQRTLSDTHLLQMSLQQQLNTGGIEEQAGALPPPAFDRALCMEFATGSVERMLGPSFAELDTYPTRVRLPDEPLMLVDRIVTLEGKPKSMQSGRVVTEHDVLPGAWYLDGGRIPTCIAVEAGQADLFLASFLGIDFITRGLAVYRLLDAVVTFHGELPRPGETISYDIRIERFFRHGETNLFRFHFEATVNGVPFLSMRDGCAGFFSEAELTAGKGIVRGALDLRPRSGSLPADWQELAPMAPAAYTAAALDLLRAGDLAAAFGPHFAQVRLPSPLTIPGGAMRLVHRVMELQPKGGRYQLGFIRAEANIQPDDWFLTSHFVDDRVMPGTLMYECCLQTLRIFLLRLGWVADSSLGAWQPVPGVASTLCCRGQVLETTRVVSYEVTVRELGYRPEPYALADALMYADGKPIVEITNMSVRLSGSDLAGLCKLWSGKEGKVGAASSPPKPAIYGKERILAYSNGKPSEAFGDRYRIFDTDRMIARLPGPPFQFLDRITDLKGQPWQMVAGAMCQAQYDIPADAWYFRADRQPRMPFSVLLEAALQPCGWLAAYVGSALTNSVDISFRNLGGNGLQHRPLTPQSGTITTNATLTKVATSGGMIIQEFDFSVADDLGHLYQGKTMFGFFEKGALLNQVGIRDAALYRPNAEEVGRGISLPYPESPPFPSKKLRMIDRIELFVPDGGPAGLGYLAGVKEVDPDEWFFKAHFFQDPVTPGSLGLESFLQLVKFAAVKRWGWHEGEILAAAQNHRHRWLYRGQVVPSNKEVTVVAWITAADDQERLLTAAGFLLVDGRPIYQMDDFTLQMERSDR